MNPKPIHPLYSFAARFPPISLSHTNTHTTLDTLRAFGTGVFILCCTRRTRRTRPKNHWRPVSLRPSPLSTASSVCRHSRFLSSSRTTKNWIPSCSPGSQRFIYEHIVLSATAQDTGFFFIGTKTRFASHCVPPVFMWLIARAPL